MTTLPAESSNLKTLAKSHYGPSQIGGLLTAFLVFGAWATCLYVSLFLVTQENWRIWPILIVLQTWLYTGLFITAHDAMHGTLAPDTPRLNHFLGACAVYLFAGFDYKLLLRCHHEHHRAPASDEDPDYHRDGQNSFLAWYLGFMLRYTRVTQLLTMTVLFQILMFGFKRPVGQLILLWNLPAILASLQLFYFGTYLPHKRPADGYQNPHRASSETGAVWLAVLKCFNFGFHFEHHEFPYVPWWRLGHFSRQYQKMTAIKASS